MLVVIEGVDGVGKTTQITLLKSYFEDKGYTVKSLHFPTHGKGFYGKLVDDYLSGKFGSLSEIPAKFSAFLYAGNREENSDKIKDWLAQGNVVLLDRYVSSAKAHQGSNFKSKDKRLMFYKWLDSLEYDLNKIPKPDKVIVLDADLEVVVKSIRNRGNLDLHEKDLSHLEKTINVYREMVGMYENWYMIKCSKGDRLRPKEDIFMDLTKIVEK